jgi:hypothetical protein
VSLEIVKVKFNNATRWRCLNENTGAFSLDDRTIEPYVGTSAQATLRLYSQLLSMRDPELQDGSKYLSDLRTHVAGLEQYRNGACVYDLDSFFQGVSEICKPKMAQELTLTRADVRHLRTMAKAIREELNGDSGWLKTVESLNQDRESEIYTKLFPSLTAQGLQAHPALKVEWVPGIDSGFRYIDFLRGSVTLAGPCR